MGTRAVSFVFRAIFQVSMSDFSPEELSPV